MERFVKKQSIASLKDGDVVNDIFVVKIKKGVSQYAKGYSFHLLLSDNTGKTIEYKYWGGHDENKVREKYNSIKPDSVVHVQGKVSEYGGKLQLTTNEPFIIEVLNEDQYNEEDFIKPPKRDINEMYSELEKAISSVTNEKIRRLLKNIFEEPEIKEKFKTHPGAIEHHHNWSGGLLQHTLEVLNYCRLSWEMFPELDKDLLTAGALLHDIGKLDELTVTSRIKGTNKGQLVGHIVLGTIYISKKMDEIGFDEDLKNKILHIIVSHHGRKEFGAPKEPMFSEATAVYYADEMSSKIAEMSEFIKESREDTEDDFMYHRKNQRNIFLR